MVNAFKKQLQRENWNILYEDYVNSQRGGRGHQGAINYCFEMIFDKFPDIVAVREQTLLIAEVDASYKEQYVTKLRAFRSKQDELFQCIKNKIGLNLVNLELGLTFQRKPPISESKLVDFHIWIYNPARKLFDVVR